MMKTNKTKTNKTKTNKTKSAARKKSEKQKQLDREFALAQTLKKSGKTAAQLDREIAEALGRRVGSGGLPMVQVKMDNGRPQVEVESGRPQVQYEIDPATGRRSGRETPPPVRVTAELSRMTPPAAAQDPHQVQTPPRPPPQKSTVTILIVTQVYHRSDEPTRTLTIVFASRERAFDAMKLHLTNPDADTTLNLRTLDVI